jgi:hypothetical protein
MASLRRAAWALLGIAGAASGAAGAPTPLELGKPPILLGCLDTGNGYLHAKLGGAIDARIDWPNSGTRCEGEVRDQPPGVRLSFQRVSGGVPDLLFLFGITGIKEGRPARNAGVNLTVIVQGSSHIYGTQGDSRCTVDSLTQTPLPGKRLFRVEARGFCTQPAHAVRGQGDLLVSTFEFAGSVSYAPPKDAQNPFVVPTAAH